MMNDQLTLKGTNGQLIADDDKITIQRKGLFGVMSQGIKGGRTIFYSDIKSIEFRKPSFFSNGYIQLLTNLELSNKENTTFAGTTTNDAIKDPNTVILRAFKKGKKDESENFYNFVSSKWNAAKSGKNVATSPVSIADEIEKFKKLLDENIITPEEFDKKKQELLSN
ncbi:DUF4429 domain-containing protein [Companilactobacillus mishanensis]|uniref:DUF4429 domain-containing protein n=1 Tax=Companilactobacillus mishanensis TaxID=2486008 RepID=A0ABW9P5T0_9LACO|nr:DUF4429 domain-containing protein [Companilactobacillus mishanensis]MQS44521.1 DUF4429 domain-containing protein [Companilactobacillus mishanensis]